MSLPDTDPMPVPLAELRAYWSVVFQARRLLAHDTRDARAALQEALDVEERIAAERRAKVAEIKGRVA